MGRHSAPDDEESVVQAAAATTATLPPVPAAETAVPRGRHAVVDEPDEAVEVVETAAAPKSGKAPKAPKALKEPKAPKAPKEPKQPKQPKQPKAAKPPKAGKEKKPAKDTGTRADLRLLRENGAVRARCIGAVLLAFLAYTVVIVVIGKADSYLFWLWVPIVVSGVLVGLVLDLAYRAKSREQARSQAEQPTS